MDVDGAPAGDAQSWALAQAHGAHDEQLKALLERAAGLLSKRLYHQLSSVLGDIIARPSSAPLQVGLYQHFIHEVSGKLDPLVLVGLAVRIARQYARPDEAVAFLEGVTERLDASKAPEARVMAVIETASYRLHLGQLDQTKLAIDQSSAVLDGLPSIEITVHASFYRVSGEYHKVRSADRVGSDGARSKPSTPTSTAPRCCTSPAWTSTRTSAQSSASTARTTSPSPRCSGRPSTTSASWCGPRRRSD